MATVVRELRNGHNIDTDVGFGIRSILAWPDRLFVVAVITMLLFIVLCFKKQKLGVPGSQFDSVIGPLALWFSLQQTIH